MVTSDLWWKNESQNISLRDIWGVGGRLSQSYSKHKVETVSDLFALERPFLAHKFGIVGLRLVAELTGESQYLIGSMPEPAKSIMSTRSFSKAVFSKAVLMDALSWHVHQVAAELRLKGLVAGSISIIMQPSRFSDYSLYQGNQTRIMTTSTASTAGLLAEVIEATNLLFKAEIPYKKAGIVVSKLQLKDVQSVSLWETEEVVLKQDVLEGILDKLRSAYGSNIIQQGRFANSLIWQSKRIHVSPSYTTRWSEIALVQAR